MLSKTYTQDEVYELLQKENKRAREHAQPSPHTLNMIESIREDFRLYRQEQIEREDKHFGMLVDHIKGEEEENRVRTAEMTSMATAIRDISVSLNGDKSRNIKGVVEVVNTLNERLIQENGFRTIGMSHLKLIITIATAGSSVYAILLALKHILR